MLTIIEKQEKELLILSPNYDSLDSEARWHIAIHHGFYELANYLRGFNMEYL